MTFIMALKFILHRWRCQIGWEFEINVPQGQEPQGYISEPGKPLPARLLCRACENDGPLIRGLVFDGLLIFVAMLQAYLRHT